MEPFSTTKIQASIRLDVKDVKSLDESTDELVSSLASLNLVY